MGAGAAASPGRAASGAGTGLTPPTQNMSPQKSIGKGEGQLNLIAWEGYAQPEWVKPFEKATGCTGQREVRRLLERDGLAHGKRRWRPVRPRVGLR